MITRTIANVTSAPLQPGFLGEGHLAAAVVDGRDFQHSDPFIILMDDRLDLPGGEPVGGGDGDVVVVRRGAGGRAGHRVRGRERRTL